MKKVTLLSLILIIVISLVGSVYAESSCKISLQIDKSEVSVGDEITVDVKLSNIQDEKGIFGMSAILEYNKESLKYISMESQEGWEKPSYYENSGIMEVLREEEYATTDQTICKIKFEVMNTNNLTVKLKDIVASNGTIDINLGEESANKSETDVSGDPVPPTPTEPTNPTNPTNPNPSENGSTSNTRTPATNAEQKIPYAGSNDNIALILWISAFILLATALFIKVKVIDKDI